MFKKLLRVMSYRPLQQAVQTAISKLSKQARKAQASCPASQRREAGLMAGRIAWPTAWRHCLLRQHSPQIPSAHGEDRRKILHSRRPWDVTGRQLCCALLRYAFHVHPMQCQLVFLCNDDFSNICHCPSSAGSSGAAHVLRLHAV